MLIWNFLSIKQFFLKRYNQAALLNRNNILELLEKNQNAVFVDLGCNNGQFTIKMGDTISSKKIKGVELFDQNIERAKNLGISVDMFDLNKNFPYKNESIDVITSNQVFEHLHSLDHFIEKIFRVLKPGGYAIISTENASSWHNIFAAIMGWQIFSLTNFSKYGCLGNPMGLFSGDICPGAFHVFILNYYGFIDFFKKSGFQIESIRGAGYYPFPAFFGDFDPKHSAFISFKLRKPL